MRHLTIAFLMLLLAGCSAGSDSEPVGETDPDIPFRKDGTLSFERDGEIIQTIAIEVADTDSSRTRGLMQRPSLPADSGMLFIFPDEQQRSFWMANTPLSLDIMYVRADSSILSIARYTTPFSAADIPSEGPARFVVEVVAGYSDSIGITEGDRVSWTLEGG